MSTQYYTIEAAKADFTSFSLFFNHNKHALAQNEQAARPILENMHTFLKEEFKVSVDATPEALGVGVKAIKELFQKGKIELEHVTTKKYYARVKELIRMCLEFQRKYAII